MIEKSGAPNKSNSTFNNKIGDNNLVTNPYSDNYYWSNNIQMAANEIASKNKHFPLCDSTKNCLAKISLTKYKQEILETLEERCRLGNYIWIYPSQGSKVYNYFFINEKPVNTAIYDFLYSDSNGVIKDINSEIISEVCSKLLQNKSELKHTYDSYFKNPSTIALNKSVPNPTITEFMIEYIAQLLIWVQDYDDKNVKTSYKDVVHAFVSHKSWSK